MNIENLQVEKELKIVYMGTPEFSAVVLRGLMEKYKIRAIVTQPDKPVGRHGKVTKSSVKQIADDNVILALQPKKIREEFEEVLALEPDLIITCAYGQIIPQEMIETPRLGCINVHASLLPKLRGGAPIHRSIINGHTKTGITIMHMNDRMDEGDIITQEEIDIKYDETAETLHDKLAILGRDLLLKTLPSIINGTASRTEQDHGQATYAFNIRRIDEKIDFSKTKKQIYNQVRGLYSWPGAYCLIDNQVLKIWKCREGEGIYDRLLAGQIANVYEDGFGVKVGNGEIIIEEVQLEGKKRMKATDFINGYSNKGTVIGKFLA